MFIPLLIAAAAPVEGATLWRDIKAGMPESALRGIYPEKSGSVVYHKDWATLKDAFTIGGCHPSVEVVFKSGGVTQVGIWSRPQGVLRRTCGDDVQTALTGKYGEPATQATDTTPVSGKSLHYTWKAGDTVIDFTRENMEASDTWHVRYMPAGSSDL